MPDVASIAATLTSIKTAIDLVKTITAADASLERAELKLKMADVLTALADAKASTVDLRELIQERDQEIQRLTDALILKAQLIKGGDAYFRQGEDGIIMPEPLCLHCWESKRLMHHLIKAGGAFMGCPSCETDFYIDEIQRPGL